MLQVFEELQVTADRAQQCPSSRFVGRQRRSASDCDRASTRNHWTCSKELVPTLACGCGQHLVSISNLHCQGCTVHPAAYVSVVIQPN